MYYLCQLRFDINNTYVLDDIFGKSLNFLDQET